ncbi:MAG: CotH kinase family protein [Chitinophagales bacterium]
MKSVWIICSVIFLLTAELTHSQNVVLDSSNLPIIVIKTFGQVIKDDPRINVFMGIIDNGSGMMNHVTDPFNNFSGKVSIEIRGSTSQYYPKKSYAFTPLDSAENNMEASILGFPEETDWILYAPYPDKTLMRNTLAYYLFNRMGHYTSRTHFAELILNEDYIGVYELHEKVKQDDNRVNIAKLTTADTTGDDLTGGYIVKIDKTTGSGDETWTSSFDNEVFFQYHDPEDENMLEIQKEYIQHYVNLFETALNGPVFTDPDSGFRKYADENSLIDFLLLEELGRTVDGYRSSCFFYKDKDSNGGKLTLGPAWDYNLSFGNANYCDSWLTTGWHYDFNSICTGFYPHVPFWWQRLVEDPAFNDNLQCRWKMFRQNFLSDDSVNLWIDTQALLLENAQERNFEKWDILGEYVDWNYFIGENYEEEVGYMKSWISDRLLWMDQHLPGTCITTQAAAGENNTLSLMVYPNPASSICTFKIENPQHNTSLTIFNSLGQRVYFSVIDGSLLEVKVSGWTKGFYQFFLESGGKIKSGILVVE